MSGSPTCRICCGDHLLYLTSAAWKCPAPQVLDINKIFQYTIVFYPSILIYILDVSKEPSHRDSSFEYPQFIFWLRNISFSLYALLTEVLQQGENVSLMSSSLKIYMYLELTCGSIFAHLNFKPFCESYNLW